MATDNNSIELRLERMERSLDKIVHSLDQAPTMVSMATDSIDEWIDESRSQGVDVQQRLQSGYQLLLRLSDPEMNQTINGLLDGLEQAPGLIAMATDTIDSQLGAVNSGPISMSERLQTITLLLDEMSKPAMAQRINDLLEISDQLPGLVAMGVDSIDAFMTEHGTEIQDALSFLKTENLLFLKNAGDAFTDAQNQPIKKVGLFGLLGALNDPDRQKAIGFLLNVLKNLGKTL